MQKLGVEVLTQLGEKIGEGRDKVCFRHRFDASLCIKINKPTRLRHMLQEINYFKLLNARHINSSLVPKVVGYFDIKSNEGKRLVGYIQECFLDKKQGGLYESVYSIKEWIEKEGASEKDVRMAISSVKEETLRLNLTLLDLSTCGNFLRVTSGEDVRFVVIDGYGVKNLIPIGNYIPWILRRRTRKAWDKFDKNLQQLF